ncbi:MAG: TonB-dependent receptor [Pseudomonas sp.]
MRKYPMPPEAFRPTTFPSRPKLSLLTLLLGQVLSPAVLAQSGDEGSDAVNLDAVKVVGEKPRKRAAVGVLGARSLQDTPFSIDAVTSEQIEQANPMVLADLFATDASVGNNGQSGYGLFSDRVMVRGLPISGSNNLVDGVRYYTWGSEVPLEAIEQVQLLKGSGGFLHGFGAPGGIVNFVSKKPTEKPLLAFTAGYESDAIFSEHVDAGGRFGRGEVFGYRFNAWHKEGKSFNGSVVNGSGAALALDARPTDTLVLSADFLYQDRRTNKTSPAIALNYYTDNVLPAAISGRTKLSSDDAYTATRFTKASIGATWQFARNWSLDLRVGTLRNDYRYPYERLLLLDSAGNYNNRLFDGSNVSSYDYARALVEGHFQTGPVYHQVVAGIDHQTLEDEFGLNEITLQAGSNLHHPVTSRWTYDRRRSVPTWRTSSNTEDAIFISDTVDISAHWSFLAGLRHTDDDEKSYEDEGGPLSGRYSTTANTPTLALLYRPRAGVTLYGSYIESLESGGTVGDSYANAGEQLKALISKQYEIGGKFDNPDWNANVALFRLDRGASYVTEDEVYTQDGITRYDGLEAAANRRFGAAWRLGLSVLALDARYQKNSNSWLIGRDPEGSSHFTSVFNASYDIQSIPGLSLHGLLRYQGRTSFYNVQSRDVTLYTPDVVLTALGADYVTTLVGRKLTLHGQVDNLFDRKYWSAGSSPTTNAISPGRPRTFTLSVKIDFF